MPQLLSREISDVFSKYKTIGISKLREYRNSSIYEKWYLRAQKMSGRQYKAYLFNRLLSV